MAEVVIAILVLSLGLMGILALFPLGAKQMADAVKDERSAQLAENQERMARLYWRMAYLQPDGTLRPDGNSTAAMFQAGKFPELLKLDVPSNGPSAMAAMPTNTSEASYPLYLDAIGHRTEPSPNFIGTSQAVPRQSISLPVSWTANGDVNTSASAAGAPNLGLGQSIRLFGLLDDIVFDRSGLATSPGQRAGQYNAAWLIQRAKNNVRQEVNLKVVVYKGRSPDTYAVEDPIIVANNSPSVASSVLSGAESFNTNSNGQLLRKGNWILLTHKAIPGSLPNPEPFADFYRVTNVNGATISVSPPIRTHGSLGHYQVEAWTMEHVVEVFDRGTLSPFEVPAN